MLFAHIYFHSTRNAVLCQENFVQLGYVCQAINRIEFIFIHIYYDFAIYITVASLNNPVSIIGIVGVCIRILVKKKARGTLALEAEFRQLLRYKRPCQ